jgi:hypothetical protein
MSKRRPYFCNCVSWPPEDLPVLELLISDSDEIPYADLVAAVQPGDLRALERGLGYGRTGLKMAEDWHVRHHRHAETGVVFVKHSAIEHVFATEADLERLREIVELRREEESLSP